MKRTIFLVPLLCLFLAIPAMASGNVTVRELDPFTGKPVSGADSSSGAASSLEIGQVTLANGQYYDFASERYLFDVADSPGAMLQASVAYGMVTTEPVSIVLPGGMSATLYRDGIPVEEPIWAEITDPGCYVLSVSGSANQSSQPLRFTILSAVTNQLESYRVPVGFSVTSVLRDGNPVTFQPQEADLSEDGLYSVSYRCNSAAIPYVLTVQVDHTPPVLALEAVKDGSARGPVDLSDAEEGATVEIALDGRKIPYSALLTQTGSYQVAIRDAAGNSNLYSFSILLYFNFNSFLFIGLVLAAVIALAVYLLFSRKHLRIR